MLVFVQLPDYIVSNNVLALVQIAIQFDGLDGEVEQVDSIMDSNSYDRCIVVTKGCRDTSVESLEFSI